MRFSLKLFCFLLSVIILSNCARTGRPEGGPKDENAPLFIMSNPPYESINFDDDEIRLVFNEFIKLKDLNKQLVVSPPLKVPLVITPQGAATKKLKIKILDTLKKNTTYIINFGNAVEDNNESNKLENFKYVFSTGNYIDSLTSSGFVKDAFYTKKLKSINVLLYRIDTAFTDSIIYKKKPSYVANTLDTTKFTFTNLRKGKYLMIALKEASNDYLFSPKTDKIGFYPDTITLPRDSIVEKPLVIFKETQPYTFKRAKEVSKGKIMFGFEGQRKNFSVKITSDTPNDFKSISKFEFEKDTLNYWYTPFEADSLNFIVSNDNFLDTVTVRLRKKKIDSLILRSSVNGTLHFRDTLFVNSNNPITKIDTSKISITDKDTIAVSYTKFADSKKNKVAILFDKKPEQRYSVNILPEAFEDIFEQKNDTLNFSLSTKEIEDYGRITVKVVNESKENILIDLVTGKNKDEVIQRNILSGDSQNIVYDLLEPNTYYLRAIVDENKNNKWDTGSYLQKKLPETILYFNEELKLRANYYLDGNIFTIKKLE